MVRQFRLFLLFLLFHVIILNGQQRDPIEYSLFPSSQLMPRRTANVTEHGLSLCKMFDKDNYWAGIGNSLPLLRVNYGTLRGDISVAATVFTQLRHKSGGLQVINTDFYVDFLFALTWNERTFIQFGPGHTSQHLNDDALEILGYQSSINYVRDYYQLFVLQAIDKLRGYVYAGALYHHTFKVPSDNNPHWLFEFGADVAQTQLKPWLIGYVAFDIKLREELRYGSTQSYQVGVKILGDSPHVVRVALTHRAGYEERGQFFDSKVQLQTLGVYFDF